MGQAINFQTRLNDKQKTQKKKQLLKTQIRISGQRSRVDLQCAKGAPRSEPTCAQKTEDCNWRERPSPRWQLRPKERRQHHSCGVWGPEEGEGATWLAAPGWIQVRSTVRRRLTGGPKVDEGSKVRDQRGCWEGETDSGGSSTHPSRYTRRPSMG